MPESGQAKRHAGRQTLSLTLNQMNVRSIKKSKSSQLKKLEGSRALAHFWSEKIGFLFFFSCMQSLCIQLGSWINRNLFDAVILVIYVPIVNCIMKTRERERASERKNIAEIDELKTRDNQESPTHMQSTKTRSYVCMQHRRRPMKYSQRKSSGYVFYIRQ